MNNITKVLSFCSSLSVLYYFDLKNLFSIYLNFLVKFLDTLTHKRSFHMWKFLGDIALLSNSLVWNYMERADFLQHLKIGLEYRSDNNFVGLS